ncbi:hypothetical protein A2U01_0053662, partial [Trifolium medium]|nr:hypothetical protein [Trifolium medium]
VKEMATLTVLPSVRTCNASVFVPKEGSQAYFCSCSEPNMDDLLDFSFVTHSGIRADDSTSSLYRKSSRGVCC